MPEQEKNPRNEKPISLAPLSAEEALRRAMNAKPDKEGAEKPKPQIEPPAKPDKNGDG